ncbi:MAG: DUF3857 domain-containing protein [Sphingobacteriaceae bacterium]
MLKSFLLLIASLLSINHVIGQNKNEIPKEYLLASTIPDSLKINANAVVRYAADYITIKAPGKGQIQHHSITTLFNEKAEDGAVLYIGYDKKYNSIGDAEMRVYNAEGNLVKKYRKSDLYDGAATDGFSIVTDDRFKAVKHTISSYPVTIEIIYDRVLNSMIDLPDFSIQQPEYSVQNALYVIAVNTAVGLNYKTRNFAIEPTKKIVDGLDSYTWQVKNLKAITLEEHAVPWKVLPKISFTCNLFEFYGVPGSLSSWKSFGEWQKNLNKDVSNLSPQREMEIRKMTESFASDKEKAKYLYEYMQKNMRYVSIQLGIGGLKPFPATYVDKKKYGDCKALSNYMKALLKAVNIPSNYAIINAGDHGEPADPNFSNDPFNHVILCIPFKNDTTWLECTSNTASFGKLGLFTENRNALLITDEGGKLVNTPKSIKEDNVFESVTNIILSPEGSAEAVFYIKASGAYRSLYNGLSAIKMDDQKNYLIKSLKLKQPDVFTVNYGNDKDGVQEIKLDLTYAKFNDMAVGDKYFYRPNVFDICNFTLNADEHRKSDFYLEYPLIKTNITTIEIPAGFEATNIPANQDFKCKYGTFQSAYSYNKESNKLINNAKFEINNHVIPASQYSEMQKFIENISKSLNKKIVIVKSGG